MQIVDVDGVEVDLSIVESLDEWDGCGWLFPDGRVLATNHEGHSYGTFHHAGHTMWTDEFCNVFGAVHVGGSCYAARRPTEEQRYALAVLSQYETVGNALEDQDWFVLNKQRDKMWRV